MKTKWIIFGVLSFGVIILFATGAAIMIFSAAVSGCNLEKTLPLDKIEHVENHVITKTYHDKYKFDSSSTSRSRTLEWGYGVVEYSSYFDTEDHGLSDVYLKVTIDYCGIPTEFQFQCIDSNGKQWVSLNSKSDNVLDYLQNQDCIQVRN